MMFITPFQIYHMYDLSSYPFSGIGGRAEDDGVILLGTLWLGF